MRLFRFLAIAALTICLAATCVPLVALFAPALADPLVAPGSIDMGGLLGQLLLTGVAIFGTPAAYYLVKLVARLAHQAGFDLDEARRARLQDIIENGIREAAVRTGTELTGKLAVGTRQMLVGEAAAYVATYGRDTLKKLNGDPEKIAQLQELVRAWGGRLLGAEVAPATPGIGPTRPAIGPAAIPS